MQQALVGGTAEEDTGAAEATSQQLELAASFAGPVPKWELETRAIQQKE